MKKTKDRIQEAAIKLFNEKGYNEVSLREIAKEAGTTIGNLTYHFPQKEDLLIYLLENLHTGFTLQFSADIHRAELLSQLLNSFVTIQRNEEQHPFYYKNINELTLCSEHIAKNSQEFQQQLFEDYVNCFQTLSKDQVFRQDLEDDSLCALAYTIITLSVVWMQNNTPYHNRKLPDLPISFVLSKLVYPYIADEYVMEYRKLCSEKNISAPD